MGTEQLHGIRSGGGSGIRGNLIHQIGGKLVLALAHGHALIVALIVQKKTRLKSTRRRIRAIE